MGTLSEVVRVNHTYKVSIRPEAAWWSGEHTKEWGTAWIRIPVLPLMDCVLLGKGLAVSREIHLIRPLQASAIGIHMELLKMVGT